MDGLLEPGATRAGDLFTDTALVASVLRVETAWLAALVRARLAPAGTAADMTGLVDSDDVPELVAAAEAGGNPALPIVSLLRERLGGRNREAARWLHRGLTSQDDIDTALMLCTRDVLTEVLRQLESQATALMDLTRAHRRTVMSGRTLTQPAVPITFGLKAAGWLDGILDCADILDTVDAALPAQFGGAAGTMAATAELAARAGLDDAAHRARDVAVDAAIALGLAPRRPWHTSRRPITEVCDALTTCCAAFGRIANDVLTLSRPEIAELAEPTLIGRGGSSTMPHKRNPVLAVLIRRSALSAPNLAARLHLAAADARDERSDGAWHLEWPALRDLARTAVVAASQTTELLQGLVVNGHRMLSTLRAHQDDLLAEQRSLRDLHGASDVDEGDDAYLGATQLIIDEVLERGASHRFSS